MIDGCFAELEAATFTKQACALLGKSRATHYRRLQPASMAPPALRPAPPNKLSEAERQHVLAVLRSSAYCDLAPAQVGARLIDDGIYLCSIRTMHRLLAIAGESRERRRQRTHPAYKRPELVAHGPNAVWSWDITKLAGPERGISDELYVVIDIYARYVVGWMVAAAETGELAENFIAECLTTQDVGREQLALLPRPGHVDDLQARRPVAGRPGRGPQPLAPARLQRQPLLGGELQDVEVLPGLPGPVRLHPARPRLLRL